MKSVGKAHLDRLQRLALRLTTSCFPTTPTKALEVLLNEKPLHIKVLESALLAWIRIERSSLPVGELGHASIQRYLGDIAVSRMWSDCCTRRFDFIQRYRVVQTPQEDIPDAGQEAGEIICFTDGSRLKDQEQSGYGFWIQNVDVGLARSLGRHATVFQAEVMAILEVASWLNAHDIVADRVCIHSDSQAALMALDSACIRSRLVFECRQELNVLGAKYDVRLRWIRGHAGTHGNERADELAREGSSTPFNGPEPVVGIASALVTRAVKDFTQQMCERIWAAHSGCRQAKEFGVATDSKRAKLLLRLPRTSMRALVSLFTGHGGFERHLYRMGLAESPTCSLCDQEDGTARHLICSCDRLTANRWLHLGCGVLDAASVATISPSILLGFLKSTGRWDDFV